MKYDKPLLAILIGIIATILFEGYMQIFKLLNLSPTSLFEANSTLFVDKPNWWIGALTGPMTGGLAGLIIYFSTKILGKDYLPIKGAFLVMFIWAVLQSTLKLTRSSNLVNSVSGNYVMAIGSGIFGALMGYFIGKYLFRMMNETQ